MFDFSDKVVVVTGGSRGIGAATCRIFAQLRAAVVINYQQQEAAARVLQQEIERSGGRAMTLRCNIADDRQVQEMMNAVWNEFGRIDVLVNNAGVWLLAPIRDFSAETYKKTLSINLDGTVFCCAAAIPYMQRQGAGRIINISSTAGQRGEAFYSAYAASKGAVISYTKSLAAELAADHILVNCVAPGWVDTDMSHAALREHPEDILRLIPLQRAATPEEIAWPVVFLASAGASFITGEIFNVNGGAVLCG
jgi:3-oxoacyl-[acyl-carrier protein] reductase